MENTWESLEAMLIAKACSLGVPEIDALDFAHDSICRLVERYDSSKWRDQFEDVPTQEAFKIAAEICTNLVRDFRRSASRRVALVVGEIDFSAIAWDRHSCISDWSGANLLRSQLAGMMPELHRQVIEHSLAGLTQSQIAERLKTPLGSVKSILHRTKKRAKVPA